MNPILKTLKQNMAYKPGEKVAIITQEWEQGLGDKQIFEKTKKVAEKMYQAYKKKDVNVSLHSYVPDEAMNGVDAPQSLYEEVGTPDIVFMPTAYSLTHTEFRKKLTDNDARVASMPGFSMELFEKGGPMDVDYENIKLMTAHAEQRLRENNYVHVQGKKTDIVVEINHENVHYSDGLITEPGTHGNLPGAESFVTPIHEGDSHGYITIPKGWGGQEPLKGEITLHVEDGRFVKVEGSEEAKKQAKEIIWSGEDHDILAELGIGTNPAITEKYIEKHSWNLLVAEKVFGSAHFANGNSAAMGGENDVPVHVDWVVPDVDITYHMKNPKRQK